MKYIKLFEEEYSLECEYKIGQYIMYINKERVFGDQLFDKPELAKIIDVLDPMYDLTDKVNLYIKIVDDGDLLWCGPENVRKLEPWEEDAIKYNL